MENRGCVRLFRTSGWTAGPGDGGRDLRSSEWIKRCSRRSSAIRADLGRQPWVVLMSSKRSTCARGGNENALALVRFIEGRQPHAPSGYELRAARLAMRQ